MAADPSEVLRWVREGEQLFGQTLQMLHRCQDLEREVRALREEVDHLRTERLETAASLKAFAEHVTKLASVLLDGIGKRAG